jgi:septal ring-binding cell division protein DamX/type II secretory pathway predicted ATPase ExeA
MSTARTSFYSNEMIEQQLDLIHHMLQFGDELLLVTGDKGVGKSRQLQELMHRLGEGWQICHICANENGEISQLFEKVSQSFGYDYSKIPSAELINGFKRHIEQREPGKTYALLIDDAEQLDASSLEAVTHLAQLQNGKGRLLRVALFGNRDLSENPLLKCVPVREVVIEPLDNEQSQDYINYCIEQGRYEFGKPPAAALQQQIVKRAAGVPGQIEAMLQGSSLPRMSWRKVFDWRVAIFAALVLAAGLGYLLLNGGESPEAISTVESENPAYSQQPVVRKQAATLDAPVAQSEVIRKAAPLQPLVEGSTTALISELLKSPNPLPQQPPMQPEEEIPVEPDTNETVADSIESLTPADDMEAMVDATAGGEERAGELQIAAPHNLTAEAAVPMVTNDEKVRDRVWLQNQPETAYTIQLLAVEREAALYELIQREQLQGELARFSFVRGGHLIHVLTQGVYADRAAAETALEGYSAAVKPWIRTLGDIQQLFIDNPPQLLKSVSAATAETGVVRDSAWLWSQDPEMIAIQLIAGGKRELLEPYVQESQRIGVTAILEAKRDSRPWFILLLGGYKTREEARGVIAELPQILQSTKPWVRSFASVQDELSRSN